jgi:hypothetical protein
MFQSLTECFPLSTLTMPTPATPAAAFRKVLLRRTSLKAKLVALASLKNPSVALLSKLIRDARSNPKLVLAAGRRLAEVQAQRIERSRQIEIDRVLAKEMERLEKP